MSYSIDALIPAYRDIGTELAESEVKLKRDSHIEINLLLETRDFDGAAEAISKMESTRDNIRVCYRYIKQVSDKMFHQQIK